MAFRGPHVDFSSFPKELLEGSNGVRAGDPALPSVPPAAFPSRSAPGAAERWKQSPGRTRAQPQPTLRPSRDADASGRPAGTRAAGPPQTQGEQPAGRRAAAERRPKAQRHPAGEAAPNAAPHGGAPEAPTLTPQRRTPTGGTPAGTAPRSAPHAHAAAPRSAQPGFGRAAESILRRGPARVRPPAAPRRPRPAALPWCTARRRPWRGARPRCGGRTGGGGRMLRRRRAAPCCCYLAGCGAPLCALWERGGRAGGAASHRRAGGGVRSTPRAAPGPALPAPGPGCAEGAGRPVPARRYRRCVSVTPSS